MCRTCLCYLCCCSLFQAFLHDRTAHAVPYRSWRRPSRKPPIGEPLCEQPRCLERQSGRLSTSRKSVIVQIAFPFHPASRPQYFRMTRIFGMRGYGNRAWCRDARRGLCKADSRSAGRRRISALQGAGSRAASCRKISSTFVLLGVGAASIGSCRAD